MKARIERFSRQYRDTIIGINTVIWSGVAGLGLAGWVECGCLSLLVAGLVGVIVASASLYELR